MKIFVLIKSVFTGNLGKNTFRRKIFLLTSFTIVVFILIAMLLIYTRIKHIYIDNAKISTKQNIDIISRNMNSLVKNIEDDTLFAIISQDVQESLYNYYLSDSPSLHLLEKELTEFLYRSLNTNRTVLGCDILLNDNNILKTSQFFHDDIENLIYNELNNYKYSPFKWYGPYKVRQYHGVSKNIFVIEKRIVSLNHSNTLGYLYMYVDENVISESYRYSLHNNSTNFLVVDENNNIISSKDKDLLYKSFNEVFDININKDNIEQDNFYNINGVNSYIIKNNIDDIEWTIITIIPMNALIKSSNEMKLILLVFTIISIFTGVFISSRISTYIAKPINMLVNTIKDITKGNRNIRADEHGESEIKILNRSFNTLMDTNDKLISEVYEKQKCIRNFEFLLLQEQIKPHFLYNSLATVSSLVKLDLKKEAVDAIQNLAKFFRISLSDGNEIITIKEEISMIESYLVILQYKFIDAFSFSINMDDEILNHNIPKLTLQPLIENAIDHGIKPKNEKTEIIVEGKILNDNIVINVKDYGVGISEKKLNEVNKNINSDNSDDFGLTCVNQRLKYMYGNDYGLSIESVINEFTNVTINLPKEEGDIVV